MPPANPGVDQLKLNHMYNIVNGISPHYLRGEVSMAGNHGHNTRSGNRACFVPRVNSFAIKSFFYTGVKLWNSLPYTTQIITTKQAFKSEVKKVLWFKLIQTNEDIFLFYYILNNVILYLYVNSFIIIYLYTILRTPVLLCR